MAAPKKNTSSQDGKVKQVHKKLVLHFYYKEKSNKALGLKSKFEVQE